MTQSTIVARGRSPGWRPGLTGAYPQVFSIVGRGGNTVLGGAATPLPLERLAARLAADPAPGSVHGPDELGPLLAGAAPARD